MTESGRNIRNLPPEQQAIRDQCFHPSRQFEEFPAEAAEQSIQKRFEEIVARYPDRMAIKAGHDVITYTDLNKTANRLAHRILALRGEGREPAAFSLTRGIAPLVAHLAVLKTGKFSVELDPAAPSTRNAHIMADSTASLMVTDSQTEKVARGWTSADQTWINLDELDADLDDRNPTVVSAPEDVAYLRYTSGSTGQAKGAIKTHRHVLHEVMDATNVFRLCIHDRVSHLSRESMGKFIFSALLNGAALYSLDTKREGLVHLAEWLMREEITSYQSFPTAFRYFLSGLTGQERFPSLRLIRLEGESLYRRDVDLYKKYFPPECLLVNSYSSAETGTVSLFFIDHKSEISGNRVPMGYPLEGKQVLLLDDHGNQVGVNQIGEIAVESRRLSSGYWRREEVTQQKFLTTPTDIDQRVYLTGDLGQVSEQGWLDHLGRKDFQMKIRGFRVDAGEVEAALADHENIKEAVVVARDDQLGNSELVAYVVTEPAATAEAPALRAFLNETLPDYMIPAHFVIVDEIPLTATGKVDRRRLPEPERLRPQNSVGYVAPRTVVEEKVAAIWRQVLSLERASVDDNFFELGGHSLAATRIVSQVVNQFQLQVPLEFLFQSPTIAAMAAVIGENRFIQADPTRLQSILDELERMSDEEALRRVQEANSTIEKK